MHPSQLVLILFVLEERMERGHDVCLLRGDGTFYCSKGIFNAVLEVHSKNEICYWLSIESNPEERVFESIKHSCGCTYGHV